MPADSIDIQACLAGARQRDETAARALVEHLHPLIARLVQAHLPRREECEDIMQDVFLKLFSHLDQYQGTMPLEHWVSRIAVNTCIDKLRAQQRRPACRWGDLTEEQQAAIELLEAGQERGSRRDLLAWEVLEKLLAALAPEERLIIQLVEIDQRSIRSVCELTGWNSGVVRIRAYRARQKLKRLYLKLGDSAA